MERVYTFEEKPYRYKVVYIGYLLVAILAYSLYRLVTGTSLFWLLPALLAGYGAANTFLTKSNPRQVAVTDDRITFRSYGEKHFDPRELTRFRVRVSAAGYQVYVRAADRHGNRGRFWVNYALFSDRDDLLKELDYLERSVHPESLRLRSYPNRGACRPTHM